MNEPHDEHHRWRVPSTRCASRRVLIVVDFCLSNAQVSQHLLVGDGLVVFQPILRLCERLLLLPGERLVIEGGLGDGAGDGIEHGFQQADDRRQLRRRQALNEFVGVFFGVAHQSSPLSSFLLVLPSPTARVNVRDGFVRGVVVTFVGLLSCSCPFS